MMREYNKSGIYLIAFALVSTGLTGCGATINNAGGSGSSTTLESGSADGTGDSVIASDTDTSVTVTPASGSAWSEFLIDLGAQFTKANICAGKTIFGRLGTAMCPEEISAGNAFRSSGSLTLADELAAGSCSDTNYFTRVTCERADASNVWTPTVATGEKIANTEADTTASATTRDTATFRYDSGSSTWVQANIPGSDGQDGWASGECGETGNIEARIDDCNRQWRATTGSKVGGGTWSLVSRQLLSAVYSEVWRDNKTGLIWSHNLGTATQCVAGGDNEAGGWCEANVTITESVCAETGFADATNGATLTIRGRTGDGTVGDPYVYSEEKGGMGMNSANPVLWRLPTLQDYTGAYQNGMAYVLPSFGTFWTSSVGPSYAGGAMYFSVDSGGYVYSAGDSRNNDKDVRCVGR